MSESIQTSQDDLCYVKICSCVVFSLQAGRKEMGVGGGGGGGDFHACVSRLCYLL